MPRNRKEKAIFGLLMCILMVSFMTFVNIRMNYGEFSKSMILAWFKSIPIVFIVVYLIESFIVSNLVKKFMKFFPDITGIKNAQIVFNAIAIVTMMSAIMSIFGDLLGGNNFMDAVSSFGERWPRNFCLALFFNLLVAGPIARKLLKIYQSRKVIITEGKA